MPIPEFDDNVLPQGVHDCVVEEIEARFGTIQNSDRRVLLTERLKHYLAEAKLSGIVKAVIINGSYVTSKKDPEDVDLIAILRSDFDWTQELTPIQAKAIDNSAIRRTYGFDAFAFGGAELELFELIATFGIVPDKHLGLTRKTRKGMLRVNL